MDAKRFAYFGVGVLALMMAVVVGFHVGSPSVSAQAPGVIAEYFMELGSKNCHYLVMENGDVWVREAINCSDDARWLQPAVFMGNFFDGGPIPTSPSTWGKVKGQYEDKAGDDR